MNSINNNVNFTARLKFNNINRNLGCWKEVSKELPLKTKEYPHDILTLSSCPEGLDVAAINTKNNADALVTILSDGYEKLMQMNNDKIIHKFKKMLSIFEYRDKEFEKATKATDEVRKNNNSKTIEKAIDDIWDTAVDKVQMHKDNTIAGDEILESAKFYI